MRLVLLTFGDNIQNHYQAIFSILSFLKSPNIKACSVVTDRADFYKILSDYVDICVVTADKLTQWKGEHDFFWRIKIKALEEICSHYEDDDILYVDSDTFLAGSLDAITSSLSHGDVYMHKNEGLLSQFKSKTERKMWQSIKEREFSSVKVDSSTAMWNAGVIGLPKQNAKDIISHALEICDQICETTCPRRLVEQFAFSLALADTKKLKDCESTIAHYWGNKQQWNQLIEAFFIQSFLFQRTIPDQIEAIKSIKISSIPLVSKQKRWNRNLKRIADRLFPDKEVVYFK